MKTAFLYTENFMKYDLGEGHPLRPARLKKTYEMIKRHNILDFYVEGKPVSVEDLYLAHSKEYVDAVKTGKNLEMYGFGTLDNPFFENIFESSLYYVGASVQCGKYSRAFNISGGLHHAKRDKASGFCVFNDCVILIKKLLEKYRRVAYIDIDVHHGDGVQEAFYTDPQVLFISMHEAGKFLFPGTGDTNEIGIKEGRGTTINVPLAPFTTDDIYLKMFKKIVLPITDDFDPEIIVTQLGVDTHYLDPLSNLCLTLKGYGDVIREMKEISKRWIALGGGGYNLETVPRAWTLAYSIMRGVDLDFTEIYEEESAEVKRYRNSNAKYFADVTYKNLKGEISEYFSI
ncbi:MAG: acetoin utilization protein AcuC [Methanomicrobia archaeon]|nr:acetoin utilization protein AcuC [Methanomicrobia archaeon]